MLVPANGSRRVRRLYAAKRRNLSSADARNGGRARTSPRPRVNYLAVLRTGLRWCVRRGRWRRPLDRRRARRLGHTVLRPTADDRLGAAGSSGAERRLGRGRRADLGGDCLCHANPPRGRGVGAGLTTSRLRVVPPLRGRRPVAEHRRVPPTAEQRAAQAVDRKRALLGAARDRVRGALRALARGPPHGHLTALLRAASIAPSSELRPSEACSHVMFPIQLNTVGRTR